VALWGWLRRKQQTKKPSTISKPAGETPWRHFENTIWSYEKKEARKIASASEMEGGKSQVLLQ
jgi:hypothetical protein